MKKRHLLAVPAVGALAMSLNLTGVPQAYASENINAGSTRATLSTTFSHNVVPVNQNIKSRQGRGTLLSRKIPMPRAWHRR